MAERSEEEIRAAQAPATPAADSTPAPLSAEATQKAIKALIRSIPSDRSGVFAFDINWSAYDSGRSSMAGKILAWVKKKVYSAFPAVDRCCWWKEQETLDASSGLENVLEGLC